MDFEATIKAETLKRAIFPMWRVNDEEGLFSIDADGMTCHAANVERTEIVQAIMPLNAWEKFTVYKGVTARAQVVGVDLKWMIAVLDCTPDDVSVDIAINRGDLYLFRGMQRLSHSLIDPPKIQKIKESTPTVLMTVSGGFFVEMTKYLAAIEAIGVEIRAYREDVQFDSVYAEGDTRRYHNDVEGLTEYSGDARGIYGIEYLVDIAAGIRSNDMVSLRFGTDTPIEIEYGVDGCTISHTLAPRIDDRGGI